MELGDLRFTAWDFGPCESASETVWLLDDGAMPRSSATLPSTARTRTWRTGARSAWLRAIDRAEDALAGVHTFYVGHGAPDGARACSPISAATC